MPCKGRVFKYFIHSIGLLIEFRLFLLIQLLDQNLCCKLLRFFLFFQLKKMSSTIMNFDAHYVHYIGNKYIFILQCPFVPVSYFFRFQHASVPLSYCFCVFVHASQNKNKTSNISKSCSFSSNAPNVKFFPSHSMLSK